MERLKEKVPIFFSKKNLKFRFWIFFQQKKKKRKTNAPKFEMREDENVWNWEINRLRQNSNNNKEKLKGEEEKWKLCFWRQAESVSIDEPH